MTLKNLLTKLQVLYKEKGDVEVVYPSTGGGGHVEKICNVSLDTAKQHEETYLFLTEYLKTSGYCGGNAFISPYQQEIEDKPNIDIVMIR